MASTDRIALFLALALSTALNVQSLENAKLESVFEKMEADVLELREEVERVYKELRCTSQTLKECPNGSYDDCLSEYPKPTCPSKDVSFAQIEACGAGNGCGSGLFDYTVPSVSIPRALTRQDGNPKDKQVTETICYSKQLDPWFVQKHEEDLDFWGDAGIEDPTFFFGSQDGTFRIYPGRHSKSCGSYDPRLRPWYTAASSGPKNIILVLDTSGSMNGQRLVLMKLAASRVVNTLSVGDRVAIVQFSDTAKLFAGGNGHMLTATAENKSYLLGEIDNFEASGGTNFYDAFVEAFNTLEETMKVELNADCNSAILFLTDGKMNGPANIPPSELPLAVMDLVTDRIKQVSTNHPTLLFTYSVSEEGDDVHDFPKELACATEKGIWSKIVDEEKLVESLASYSLLFSLGLGDNRNKDFVAWIEAYEYSTGGVMGTTVSAPVYDRTTSPHIFIGAVGIDITVNAIERLGDASADEVLSRIVTASTARCPLFETDLCGLESFRRKGSLGDEALCSPGNCTDKFIQTEPKICSSLSDLPSNVFDNTRFSGKGSYEEKVCCLEGENEPTTSCPSGSSSPEKSNGVSSLAIGLIIVGVIVKS